MISTDVIVLPDGRMDVVNAANYLGFSKNTLKQWRWEGRGPPFVQTRPRGRVWYFKSDLDRWLHADA